MGFQYSLIALLLILSSKAHAVCAGNSPPGYHDNGLGICMPDPPSSDFDQTINAYPSCGAGRIALSGDGSYSATSYSSSGSPRWNGAPYQYTSGTDTEFYSFTSSAFPNTPVYGYPPGWRCYCMSTLVGAGSWPANTGQTATPLALSPIIASTNQPRQYPVTYDAVSSQTQNDSVFYAPVAIAKDGVSDGRLFNSISGGATAGCGCPNFNETAVTNGGDPNWSGTHCVSMVSSAIPAGANQTPRVLATYMPAAFSSSQIVSTEVMNNGAYIASISLPNSGSDQVGMTPYTRKIWTCADPYQLDATTNPASCIFVQARHQCEDGTTSTQASAVSDLITGANKTLQFDNVVNPKLACCLNAFHTDNSDTYEKFDCIDNSQKNYTSFDQLWADTDDALDGGQLNAILLSDGSAMGGANAAPRIISGFYGLDGHHCDQFSEFAYAPGSTIVHYRVDPIMASGQQIKVGGSTGYVATGVSDPLPGSNAYTTINTKVLGRGKTVPSTRSDFLNCPLLARAAIVASCPSSTMAPNALTSVNNTAAGTPRCAAAGGIQIHLRIEQVFEISGSAPVPPMDTMLQINATTSLDVTKIITSKIGDQCPIGTTKKGELCSY